MNPPGHCRLVLDADGTRVQLLVMPELDGRAELAVDHPMGQVLLTVEEIDALMRGLCKVRRVLLEARRA